MFFLNVTFVVSRLSLSQLLPMMPMALGVFSTYLMTSALVFTAEMLGLLIGFPPRIESTAHLTAADCLLSNTTSMVPIIMITARGEDYDKIMGLDIGADDYVIKPFSAPEVMARVRAVLRRLGAQEPANAQTLSYANLYINLEKYAVQINGEEVPLTKKEIELLWTLAKNSTKVFSRDNLLDSIWGYDYFGDSRTVDSHIKRLRAKLDKYEHPLWEIKTIWGVGYRFEGHKDE